MPALTLTAVTRADGKVYVQFGKHSREFNGNADAAEWAQASEDDIDTLRRILARVAIARNLVPAGAGGPVNLTLTYNPTANTLANVLRLT